jgi:3-oxoacyl-[acyl-carrier protein] reductase
VVTNSARNHVAIVTGANHGIGAATAVALAARGCSVLCTFLRIDEPAYRPAAYRDNRAQNADAVVGQIRDTGGRALAIEADLSDPGAPASLFDTAEQNLGAVDILINNATGPTLSRSFTAPAEPTPRSRLPGSDAGRNSTRTSWMSSPARRQRCSQALTRSVAGTP